MARPSVAKWPGAAGLQVLADGQRWQVLAHLAQSDRRVGELVELTGSPQNLVSYHVKALRSAGLVVGRRSAADGRDTYYRLDHERLTAILAEAGQALHPGLRFITGGVDLTGLPRRPRPRVLFLCTGNSARSQMAEAFLTSKTCGAIEARSAGTNPKPLHPNAVLVMAERGIDISGNQTRHLERFIRTRFDRVVTLCDKAREVCPELPGQPAALHWSMADPASSAEGAASDTDLAATLPAFERTADEIDARVELLIAQIARAAREQEQA